MDLEVIENKSYGRINARLVLDRSLYKTLIFVDGKLSQDGGEIIHCPRLANHLENITNARQVQREFFLICLALRASVGSTSTISGDMIRFVGGSK